MRIEIAPENGAALLSLQSLHAGQWRDWLVDSALASTISTPPCFPLVPFANRIADGRLKSSSEVLPANRPHVSVHPIHGYAWQAPWSVGRQEVNSVELSYDGSDDPWPWRYRASLSFMLAPQELQIHMKLQHLGAGLMPAGFGLHPAFPTDGLLGVKATTNAFLAADERCLPVAYRVGATECTDLITGSLPKPGIDSDFDGWQNSLRMEWWDRSLLLSSDPVFTALHVFRPKNKPLLCLEPVSHLTGAMAVDSLPEIPAPQMLRTNEVLEGTLVFRLIHH
ncbi:aldose 1-epimerase [Congregibacter brevis]|uniref:Aldose 1-epimerase n=1 Tax=Congregibacter brevis TaxID=3081201 RepID=A0ABZ0ID70_9GAMM|nr:aldose 1-epimerase [Congregibacter sp. IMCC45268]